MDDLLREANITFRALGFDVVQNNGPAVARRLAESNIPWNYRTEQLCAEVFLQVGHDLI